MEKEVRNRIQRATQAARQLLEEEYRGQLEGIFDILLDGSIAEVPGAHLTPEQRVVREKLVAVMAHKRASGMGPAEAVAAYMREAAFTMLNRLVALKMLEARRLVQECVSKGEESSGFREFIALALGLVTLTDKGYRLYVESLFDEIGREVGILFDRRDVASLLWPRRQALQDLLAVLNDAEIQAVWGEDETIGWVYQYFNSEEERRRMRKESQAPRNSHELAVRNQFFTPRYVVEFLTDNTLGRIWYEMTGGNTALAERCRYLVKNNDQPLAERPRKDPRELKVLDPACGSGHFLLYVFDLLLVIYEEAWQDEQHQVASEATGRSLRQDYADRDALLHALPVIILECNLYGVDIDPRAAQIASLTLWMRAQRAFLDAGVKHSDRPVIRRTRIVVAEPMPGDEEMVRAFASELRPPLLSDLFAKMVDEMKLAGELGTLLRIEEAIAGELERARMEFVEQRRRGYYLPGMEPGREQGDLDFSGIDDTEFFHRAEELIVGELRRFAEERANGGNVRRRLFAEDAAQGIALIDVCRTRFDVVLMNPPFGQHALSSYQHVEIEYAGAHADVFATFVRRALQIAETDGLVGAITSRSFIMRPRMEVLRRSDIIPALTLLLDLGTGVMDGALVEAAAAVLDCRQPKDFMAFDARRTDPGIMQENAGTTAWGVCSKTALEQLPKALLLYSLPYEVSDLLMNGQCFEPSIGTAREGMKTFDNERFLRLAWEVEPTTIGPGRRWLRFAKGGEFGYFWGLSDWLLNWDSDGSELREVNRRINGSTAQVRQASCYWFLPGATYTYRSSRGFSARVLPSEFVFSNSGPAILLNGASSRESSDLEYLLGWLNSRLVRALAAMQANAGKFLTGIFKKMPWVVPREVSHTKVSSAVRHALRARMEAERCSETSPFYTGPLVCSTLGEATTTWVALLTRAQDVLETCLQLCDREVDHIYGIDSSGWGMDVLGCSQDEDDGGPCPALGLVDASAVANAYRSWAIGAALGRWNPEPSTSTATESVCFFDALPSEPPCLASRSGQGIAVDDPGHRDDLACHCENVFAASFGREFTSRYELSTDGIREWLRDTRESGAWLQHTGMYSSKDRKSPIYWQLATPNSSYSVWLYYHRFTRDTMFQVLNDYVAPKVQHEERQLTALRQEAGPKPSASQRREIDEQETFAEELRAFRQEVARVAPLWNPDLNDGVIINFAPLWRLVPQHRQWQKECKDCFDKLVVGDYDWAHLAMHLWPERVVTRCAEDRSLAIAHGLEEDFWFEDEDGKWQPRSVQPCTVENLIRERTSAAVKAALNDLLSAPAQVAAKKAARGSVRKQRAKSAPRPSLRTQTPVRRRPTKEEPQALATRIAEEETLSYVREAIASIAGGASKSDVLASTGLSESDWNRAIQTLLQRGDVTRTGVKRGTRYHVVPGERS